MRKFDKQGKYLYIAYVEGDSRDGDGWEGKINAINKMVVGKSD